MPKPRWYVGSGMVRHADIGALYTCAVRRTGTFYRYTLVATQHPFAAHARMRACISYENTSTSAHVVAWDAREE